MKYWRGYLVAAIIAAITWALDSFAKSHAVLVDMIYPYVSRLVLTTLADWSGAMAFNLWQILLLIGIAVVIVTAVLMILFRWNFFQWLGWVLAGVSCVVLLNTGVYGLNQYASPLADDIRLEISTYDVSELNETTLYFRDKANELSAAVSRDAEGLVDIGTFEELAGLAGDGFHNLTYEEAMSVFAGSTAPVKKQGWFRSKGDTGMMIPITGEASVNPNVPNAALPFAMAKEMAHRMSIYSDADATFAAILAGMHNPDVRFQYASYLMAYHYCYQSLLTIPTTEATNCAKAADNGISGAMRRDLESCVAFFGDALPENHIRQVVVAAPNTQDTTPQTDAATESTATEGTGTATTSATEAPTTAPTEAPTEAPTVAPSAPAEISSDYFSAYTSITDLLASWYIQVYIAPLYEEEETPFNPFDPTQVDISGIINAPAAS